jgi:uncharacterized protein YjdB
VRIYTLADVNNVKEATKKLNDAIDKLIKLPVRIIAQIGQTINPEVANPDIYNFTSSNPEIASVNANGDIQLSKIGTVLITVAAKDGTISTALALSVVPYSI